MGDFTANWQLRFDSLTAVMAVVITAVSSIVHIYSIGYMAKDPGRARFMSYLSLFTFAMLMLVSADNLIQLFFGWEGVGLASYLLIGFWYHKESAHKAAMKAFIVNRVGDFGFILGILAIYYHFGSVDFGAIFANARSVIGDSIVIFGTSLPTAEIIALLLFIGAMGKSAQLGLHVWLPDAMEGPTPVSALIHAATMVTAGVFMMCRVSPIIEYAPFALSFITFIGASTAVFAATIGMTQFDIKRVIAYSTCSQLGYMFFAIGLSAYPAAMFHLFTHAFFKALLFLGAGSVIHAMSHEQDMRNMGGIAPHMPITCIMMWIGSLALAGVPFFAGFYSKDMILEASFAADSFMGYFAFWAGCLAAFLTAFYSWRLLIMTFYGPARAPKKVMDNIHESPKIMTLPLFFLAIGAIFSGFFGFDLFVGEGRDGFWQDSLFILGSHKAMEAAHDVDLWVKLLPIIIALLGIFMAIGFYKTWPKMPARMAEKFYPLQQLFFNKWYFDEIYDAIFVRPSLKIGRFLWRRGDIGTIDKIGPDGISGLVLKISAHASRMQTGFVFHYAFAMLMGMLLLMSWYFLRFF